jgi:hypothetical protein
MKKLFTLTIMLITLSMNAQDYAHASNPVSEVVIFKGSDANGLENALTVPEGGFITFSSVYDTNGSWVWAFPDGTASDNDDINMNYTALPEGYKFYFDGSGPGLANSFVIVYAHEYSSSGSTFSYTEAELNNSVKLFPNPTTSEVALNSEKTYEIEVFDILGNKVMELVGNSINMEHLSNATYIVNALDVETQESLSYKVIKK